MAISRVGTQDLEPFYPTIYPDLQSRPWKPCRVDYSTFCCWTELGRGVIGVGFLLVEVFEAVRESRRPLHPATSLTAATVAPCTGHEFAPASRFQYNAPGNSGIVLDACTIRLHLADVHIPASGTPLRLEESTSST
ncbi:hypothetical protein CVT26_008126 [Gymnopilus dilepis]|uniref:Uncharacterized protein n=1 Tax=Gymnopilus dilepis TaxID=231916 RepID=A0A409YJX3_9AGAR|nr:hypothetical protein CVT26_008126 [Gymnopilus dilepis]